MSVPHTRLEHHLTQALDHATDDRARFHLRQALQLMDVVETETGTEAANDVRLIE